MRSAKITVDDIKKEEEMKCKKQKKVQREIKENMQKLNNYRKLKRKESIGLDSAIKFKDWDYLDVFKDVH